MNKCEIVQDLLPLYKDEVVSASSIEMIEEHLKSCEDCTAALAELQGEVKVSLSPEHTAEISSFRLFKRKLFKRKIITVCVSVVAAIALIFGTYLYLDSRRTVVPYEDGSVTDVLLSYERQSIDVVTNKKTAGWHVSYITVNENGKNVRIVFLQFYENAISRWLNSRSDGMARSINVVSPGLNYHEPFDRCEIYYFDSGLLSDVNLDSDYSRLRNEADLIWSGSAKGYNLVSWRSFELENATERQKMERMTQFLLHSDGKATLLAPVISSYMPPLCTYAVEGDEMVFRAIINGEHDRGFYGLEDGDVVARFAFIDENTLEFLSSEVVLFAEPNGRYVAVP